MQLNEAFIGVSADQSSFIAFALEPQQQSNWCWAAIAVSLARYYGVGEFTQHQVALAVLGTRQVYGEQVYAEQVSGEQVHAESVSPDRFNTVALLEDALRHVGCRASWTPGRPELRDIAAEIAAGRPVCACLQWRTGDAHYVVLTGCLAETGELTVEDPLQGRSLQKFDAFPGVYRSAGTVWRGVYWTAPDS